MSLGTCPERHAANRLRLRERALLDRMFDQLIPRFVFWDRAVGRVWLCNIIVAQAEVGGADSAVSPVADSQAGMKKDIKLEYSGSGSRQYSANDKDGILLAKEEQPMETCLTGMFLIFLK